MDTKDINGMFEDETTKPQSNWFSFEKVGDTIGGELIEFFDKETQFGQQRVYVVRAADGKEWNVPLKHTTHKMNIQQLKSADPGDMVAFRLKELVDTGKGNLAKSIECRIRHVTK